MHLIHATSERIRELHGWQQLQHADLLDQALGRRRSSLQMSKAVERTAPAFKQKFPAARTLLCTPDRDECGVFRVPSHL